MKIFLLAAALVLAGARGARAAEPANADLRYESPKGWTSLSYANGTGADPVVNFSHLLDAFQIRTFGASGSAYATPEAFLKAPGDAPVADGTETVAGRKLTLYRRRFALDHPGPDTAAPRAAKLGVERFCILPLPGGRFAVVSYLRSSPAPSAAGAKAWRAFLKTIRLGAAH